MKSVHILPMDTKTRAQLESALKNAKQMVVLIESMLRTTIEVPEAIARLVASRMAERICLSCLKKIAEGEPVKRGNHIACYNTHRARIRAGSESEDDLVIEGKLSPEPKKPGRAAAMDLVGEASETIAQSIADQIAPRKIAEPKEKLNKRSKRSK